MSCVCFFIGYVVVNVLVYIFALGFLVEVFFN